MTSFGTFNNSKKFNRNDSFTFIILHFTFIILHLLFYILHLLFYILHLLFYILHYNNDFHLIVQMSVYF